MRSALSDLAINNREAQLLDIEELDGEDDKNALDSTPTIKSDDEVSV